MPRQTRSNTNKHSESTLTEEQIRQRAYELSLARGGAPGREEEDWTHAERQLRKELQGGRA